MTEEDIPGTDQAENQKSPEKGAPPPPLETELKEYKDKYLRLLADMENARKRLQKEKQELMRYGIENVLSEILTPMDNLENALKHAQKMSGEVKTWATGFQMILAQLKDVL